MTKEELKRQIDLIEQTINNVQLSKIILDALIKEKNKLIKEMEEL